jgi:hypothetical protein
MFSGISEVVRKELSTLWVKTWLLFTESPGHFFEKGAIVFQEKTWLFLYKEPATFPVQKISVFKPCEGGEERAAQIPVMAGILFSL